MDDDLLLPGVSPVVPGYWITLHDPKLQGFVRVNEHGHQILIMSVGDEPLTKRDYMRLASVTTENMIRATGAIINTKDPLS